MRFGIVSERSGNSKNGAPFDIWYNGITCHGRRRATRRWPTGVGAKQTSAAGGILTPEAMWAELVEIVRRHGLGMSSR
jgi:hypothetical protein